MKTNRVDTVLTTADFDAAKAHVAALTALVPFAVAVPDQERVGLPKLGDKSLGFVDKALEAAQDHGQAVPASVSLEGFARDAALHKQLSELSRGLYTLARAVEDTAMVAGSEAYQAALQVYGYLQAAAKTEPGLAEVVGELGKRFERQRARKEPVKPA